MADVKISALPSYTGSAEDLRWFVMNNSGETETFKFSGYTSPLKKGTAANSIIANHISSGGNGINDILISTGSTIASSSGYNTILGGSNNTIPDGSYDSIYNSIDSQISGFTGTTMLGTNNRSAALNNITYVENIHTFQTPSTQTQVQQSAPFTGASAVNLALGGHPRLYVDSNTDIETIGVRDGQSFVILIENDNLGPYTINWTNNDLSVYNTPYNYRFAEGNSGTGLGTYDLFRCDVFEDVIYCQRSENYS